VKTKYIGYVWTLIAVFFSLNLFAQAGNIPLVRPEEVGMSSERLDALRPLILEGIEHWEYPGAVLVVGRKGNLVLRKAYGYFQWFPEERSMKISSLFDLASLTKPIATATSVMILVEKGKIRLWDKVKSFVPGFKPYRDEKNISPQDARIWHLLTHTSGLPPYMNSEKVSKKYGNPCSIKDMVHYIAGLDKIDPPGKAFHYSCLGYITLAAIIKQLTGASVAEFSKKHIFQPLHMKDTGYNPPPELLSRCVPTESFGRGFLQGRVHDPLARLLGGVSGNAGLFSTADDLAIFAQMVLNGGEYNGVRILGPLTVERMTEIYPRVSFSGRGLGWDLDSSYATNRGDLFGAGSFGHTGYTGTSIWIDPETQTFVIFHTNRVHPDDRGSVVSLRSRVANVVAASIIEKIPSE